MERERTDEVGRWSEDKLRLLKDYLEAYVRILRKQNWCKGFYYIDAFAGTGRPKLRDEQRYIEGSPLCALTVQYPFTAYYFIEKTRWRVKELFRLREEFKDRDIHIEQGDCNSLLRQRIFPSLPYNSFKRAILFLDPFGMQVEWEVIYEAAELKTIEILLNFPIMAINRAVLLNNPYKMTEKQKRLMTQFWGTSDWQADIYFESPGLFEPIIEKRADAAKAPSDLFKMRLEEVFPQVSDPLVIRNSKNTPLYCLFFAGHNQTGKEIVESIFGRFEKLS